MYQRRTASFVALALLALAPLGCAGKKSGGDAPAAPAPAPTATPVATPAQPQSFDPVLSREYSALPPHVVIEAQADAYGNPVPGTAIMRSPGQTSGLIASADQAQAAFSNGQAVPVVGSGGNELDASGSTQSWSSYQGVTNYATYAPVVFSGQRQGVSYAYGQGRHYVKDGHVYFVYDRPACNTAYCAPGTVPGTLVAQGGLAPSELDAALAQAFQANGVRTIADADFQAFRPEQAALGQRLFYDTVLSASGQLSCSTCHVERLGTANVYSLQPGGLVLTGQRSGAFAASDLLPRNVPALFNLGHQDATNMFWDGRVARDPAQPSGFRTPAGAETPAGLQSALAAQALFPLVNAAEMGCSLGDGGQALQSLSNTQQWAQIMARVLDRPDYRAMLQTAYPEVQNGAFGIQHVANAIAAFEASHWRADNAPIDRYLRGDLTALSDAQKAGAGLFYGKAHCGGCHAGSLMTDHGFHATGVPQFGPGAGDGAGGHDDFGLGRVTGNPSDRYKFRTPSLRNVSTTGPWGHDGAWTSLRQFVLHYTDAGAAMQAWNPSQLILPSGFSVASNGMAGVFNDQASRAALLSASHLPPLSLSSGEVDLLMEFLLALTDDSVAQNSHNVVVQH